ncbi:MAG: phenylacetate--CoA ligase [delta proteobacterium ML8_D]|nr:MAG: phenylacetate--CoA ligase [Firmicutes bacterium ML8_F2]OPL12290.1 MAG: phenylacetate--CoA ligase [delta proteobacterium ML8_D]
MWNRKYEAMAREQLEKLQFLRLKQTLERVYQLVPFYRRRFESIGAEPGDIRTTADLAKLPFTVKNDLRDNYPYGLFTVDLNEVVRVHASSGTTGIPTLVGYNRHDLDVWAELMARTLTAAGGNNDSVVHVAYGYGLFTGGLGAHYGAEKIGATVIPISGGQTRRQVRMMHDLGATLLACTPSYALYIAETMDEMGLSPADLKLRSGVFGAEPWSDNMRRVIEEKMKIDAYDIYGLSEVIGPGVSFECSAKDGLHISEDHFIPEIINPQTGEILPDGETGELVITSISKEVLPVVRYRTRDITSLNHEKCACERTHVRMKKVSGRSDDMLIIRGVNVFPSQVESILLDIGETEPYYQLVVDRIGSLDTLEVLVEVSDRMFSDQVRGLESLENRIRTEIDNLLGISAEIKLVEPKSIPRSEGKAKRVIDKRTFS